MFLKRTNLCAKNICEAFQERSYTESHRLSLLESQSQQCGNPAVSSWMDFLLVMDGRNESNVTTKRNGLG